MARSIRLTNFFEARWLSFVLISFKAGLSNELSHLHCTKLTACCHSISYFLGASYGGQEHCGT